MSLRLVQESLESKQAKMLVDEFMNTEFEGGRHERRVNMVMDIEARNF